MSSNHWSNRISFIITTSAFAVGLGNIWRFPYVAGESGGGAFLLVYLALMLLVGIPILMIEIALGRMAKTTPLIGYGKITKHKSWNSIGWLGVVGNLLIMCYYVMIMAWVAIYGYECFSGSIFQLSPGELPDHFKNIASDLDLVIYVILGIVLLATIIVSRGLQSGLEKYAKWMMISFVLIILAFAIWAMTLPEAMSGYRWFLSPDFTKLNIQIVINALGQLFFSLGVGMAVAFAFGSYTDDQDNLVTSTGWIVFADTGIAILAGFMLFPIIFSFNLSPDSGPNLVFVTMSSVFGKLEYGRVLGGIFFLLLFLAGFTTLISSIQAMKDSLADRFKLPSGSGLMIISIIIFMGSIPVVFSYAKSPWQIFGIRIFDLMDFLTNHVMLPVGGLLVVLFGGWVIGFKKVAFHLESNGSQIRMKGFWRVMVQWIIPAAVLVILLNGFL